PTAAPGTATLARCLIEMSCILFLAAFATFSESRAQPLVQKLAGEIGPRVMGTPQHQRAAAWLVDELRKIPRVEVVIQDDEIVEPTLLAPLAWYRVRNVLARLPGHSADAILLSAHYDSPSESPGAGDDAMAVAAVIETLRAMAAEPEARNTVVVN